MICPYLIPEVRFETLPFIRIETLPFERKKELLLTLENGTVEFFLGIVTMVIVVI